MKKSKKMLICLSMAFMSAASSGAHASFMDGTGCEPLNFNRLKTIMDEKQHAVFKDPFEGKRCVPISFRENDTSDVTKADFGNSQAMFNVYQNFLERDETMVSEVFLADGRIYKFIKIDAEHDQHKYLKERAEKSRSAQMEANFDEWVFMHELFHLSDRSAHVREKEIRERAGYSGKRMQKDRLEVTHDIASVLMVTINQGLTMEQSKDLMKGVYKVRRVMNSRGAIDHYDQEAWKNALKNFDTMIGIAEGNIPDTSQGFSQLVRQIESIAYDMQDLHKDEFLAKHGTKDKNKEVAHVRLTTDDEYGLSP